MGSRSFTLRRGGWSEAAAGDLAAVETETDPDFYRAEVEARAATLLDAYLNGSRIGTLVYRTEDLRGGAVHFVIMAAAARTVDGASLILEVTPALERYAAKLGCTNVRLETMRKGMLRQLGRLGYVVDGIVMQKALTDG